MRLTHVLIAAIAFALTAPSTAEAACLCELVPASRGGKPGRPWNERDRIFIGEVVDADPLTAHKRTSVLFVTEASWRGAMPDTVRLLISDDAGCVYYSAGGRYLVHADLASPGAATLVTSQCDGSWTADHPVSLKRIAELGPAPWRAPPFGNRALDSVAIRIGQQAPRDSSGPDIAFGMPIHPVDSVVRFQIAEHDWPNRHRDPVVSLPPGLYQFRMTWSDGFSYASYVLLRCERRPSGEGCAMWRSFPKRAAVVCPAPSGAPFLPCQVDSPPAPVQSRPMPRFPESLVREGISETVRFTYVVDPNGRADVRTLAFARPPHRILGASLRNTIHYWRFSPGTLGGRTVAVRMDEVFVFNSSPGTPPFPLRTMQDTLPDGVPRTTIGRPLRDSSAALRVTAKELLEAQWSAIGHLIDSASQLPSIRSGTSRAKLCVTVLHGDDAPETAAEEFRRMQRLTPAVVGADECPRTYRSMQVELDSLGRRVVAPPGWVDPYWIRITKAVPWSRDAVDIEAELGQGPGGHGYRCGAERVESGWEATCSFVVSWSN